MSPQGLRGGPDTTWIAVLAAELTHLANVGRADDSLCIVLGDGSKVTIRP
jgi:hypothetical protein